MSKKLLLTLMSVLLIWQSYKLIPVLSLASPFSWPIASLLGWIVNMFVTGIFAFAGFALPTQRLLPDGYYHISKPRHLKQICKIMRVDLFTKFLLATVWRSKTQRIKHFDGTKAGISNLQVQSMKSEIGHLFPFLILTVLSIYWTSTSAVKLGLATLVLNILGNLYPILLQRHHRMRIQIIENRYKSQ